MKFIAYDADDAGRLIQQAMSDDNVEQIRHVSAKIEMGNKLFEKWVNANGGQIVSSGGDQGLASFPDESALDGVQDFKEQYEQMVGHTVTIGIGDKASEASNSMFAGKVNGKNQIVEYSPEVDEFLHAAHQHASAGEGNDEENKMDESYLSHLYGDDSEGSDDSTSNQDGPVSEGTDPNYLMHDEDEVSSDEPEEGNYDAYQEEDLGPESDIGMEDSGADTPIKDRTDMIQDPDQHMENEKPLGLDTEEEHEKDADQNELISEEAENEKAEGDEEGDNDKQDEDPNQDEQIEEQQQDPDSQGDSVHPDQDMPSNDQGDGSGDLKQSVAQNLEAFKAKKDQIEKLKETDPELYQAVIGLLQNMIQLSEIQNQAMGKSEGPK